MRCANDSTAPRVARRKTFDRATRLFDRITVAIARNPGKGPLFTPEQRLELVQANIAKYPHVTAVLFDGLLVEFAIAQKADALIRGLRALSDFEFEFQMALTNRRLEPKIETIFLTPREDCIFLSSRIVKEVARLGGDVAPFVSPPVLRALAEKFPKA